MSCTFLLLMYIFVKNYTCQKSEDPKTTALSNFMHLQQLRVERWAESIMVLCPPLYCLCGFSQTAMGDWHYLILKQNSFYHCERILLVMQSLNALELTCLCVCVCVCVCERENALRLWTLRSILWIVAFGFLCTIWMDKSFLHLFKVCLLQIYVMYIP